MFMKLDYLDFTANLVDHQQISFEILSPPSMVSADLLNLNINVDSFNDCLYLLHVRFENLHGLCVRISRIYSDETIINNKVSQFFGLHEFRSKEFSTRTFGPGRISDDFSDRDKNPI
jgi:hypothetical protein